VVDVILREGGRTRALRVRLEPFTLVGATTSLGELSKALRDRFRLQERLDPYEEDELAEVVSKAAVRLGTSTTPEAAARRSRGSPREAIRILERARDVAQLQAASVISVAHVGQAAARLGIDERGLDRVERQAVKLLAGRRTALGVRGIAAALGIDLETYEEVHEPWLERSGLTTRRRAGKLAEGSAPGSRRE
jgi:Holliday junction DNA helicase RuvB